MARRSIPTSCSKHACLTLSSDASQTRGWAFRVPKAEGDEVIHLKPGGPLDCSDGQVLHDWCLAGYGIAWRSTWEVESEIAAGRLLEVLTNSPRRPTASTPSSRSASTCRCGCACGSTT